MSTDDVQRSLGRIEGTLKAHAEQHAATARVLASQDEKLDTIIRGMERDKGERTGHRRAAVVASGLVSLLVSGLAVAVSWLAGGSGKP